MTSLPSWRVALASFWLAAAAIYPGELSPFSQVPLTGLGAGGI
jgi:hypothetical protein